MSQHPHLANFELINRLCYQLKSRAFLWGGWIPDVYSGRVIREHSDAEFLVENLYSIRSQLSIKLAKLGWQTKIVANQDIVVSNPGIKIHFGHLQYYFNQAEWKHNGNNGSIYFPKSWLNQALIEFMGYKFHAVTPEFQYILKLNPQLMNPNWGFRQVDELDIANLEKILQADPKDLSKLNNQMSNKPLR